MTKKELPEWAKFIIGQAVADIEWKEPKPRERAEEIKGNLEGTALAVNQWMLDIAFDLIDKKVKLIEKRSGK